MVRLRVVEALQDDAYKGIARIDGALMKKLDLERGDIIVIKGNRETYSVVDIAYPSDMGEEIIRMDGITRRNSKSSIGDMIEVKKAAIREAKKITIAPTQQGIMVRGDPDGLRRGLLGKPVVKGDILVLGGTQRRKDLMGDDFSEFFGDIMNQMGMPGGGMPPTFSQLRFSVINTYPNAPCVVTENTEINLSQKAVDVSDENIPEITYEDIGGLKEEVKKVRELVELPLKRPEIFSRLGIDAPRGVLLHGPPGTGKTLLARAVATESDANFIVINGPEIMSKFYGDSEKKIREIFDDAEKNAPSIIFIDEIDAIAPKREESTGEVEKRVVSQLLTMMDGLQARGKVVVIGATNRPNAVDPALRRPGRFDREVEINVPDKEGRLQILKIHTRNMPLTKGVNLEQLASKTHGFVGADLESLAKEAAMVVLRRNIHKFNLDDDEEIPQEVLDALKITKDDFRDSLKVVRPSAMREVLVETPDVKWSDVGGVDKVKGELKEAIEWPLKYGSSFEKLGINPPRGILLYGPPGTGKTLLAKAVATESEANFIQVKGPSLLSMWVGKSEEGVRKIFERARQVSPCVVFFDEIDALASKRGGLATGGSKVTENVLNQMLSEMDGIEDLSNVIVVGATNRPDILDPALLRPGRFDRIVYVPVPSKEGRREILEIHTKKMPIGSERKRILDWLSEETEGFTGADLESLARESAILSLRENMDADSVSRRHFEEALNKVRPSVSRDDEERYKQIEKKYLRSAKASLLIENTKSYLS